MQTPTIGRKVWLWVSTDDTSNIVLDSKQAFDASVTFVHADGTINASFCDHESQPGCAVNVPLYDPKETDMHTGGGNPYATWMPYQKAQHEKVSSS